MPRKIAENIRQPWKKNIVIVINDYLGTFGRGVMMGATRYGHTHRWRVSHGWVGEWVPRSNVDRVRELDGILAATTRLSAASTDDRLHLSEIGVPIVNVATTWDERWLPSVLPDNHAVGAQAAEHLLSRGLTHFAYRGYATQAFSSRRREGFVARLKQAGFDCFVEEPPFPDATDPHGDLERATLRRWLTQLPKPVGLMAGNDITATTVIDACLNAGLHVPDDVAVVGADNSDVECASAPVPLSSIDLAADRIGFEAAALLDLIIMGKPLPPLPVRVPPAGIVVRDSSNTYATADEDLAHVLHFIHAHATEGITVKDLLQRFPLSRWTLEHRFRQVLGRSPYDEIQRTRLQRAELLLSQTETSIADVAEQTGFRYAHHFSRVFRQWHGMTPGEYRKSARPR